MTELRDHYDWIAVGQSPGALLGSALAARQGLSVLVLPGPDESQLVSRSPTELLESESCFLPNRYFFERALKAVFGEIPAWVSSEKRDLPQLVTPEARFSIADARRHLPREVGATFERLDAEAERFWKSPPPRGSQDSKRSEMTYLEAWGSLTKDLRSRLARVTAAPWAQGWGVACGVSGAQGLDGATLLGMAQSGYWIQGGLSRLRQELLKGVELAGGHVARGAECTQVFVEKSAVSGVQVSDKGQTIGARAVIGGEPLRSLKAKTYFASGASVPKKIREVNAPSEDRFSIALSVHREAIPPGLGSLTVWSEEGAPPMVIQLLRTEDYGLGECETRSLALSVLRDDSLRAKVSDGVLAARLVRKATDLIPFLEFHMVQTTSEVPPIPLAPSPGIGFHAGVERLYLATAESYPHVGNLGSFLAGMESVEHHLGRVIS